MMGNVDQSTESTESIRLLSEISHELKTPLNIIMGMNDRIIRAERTGVPVGFAEEIAECATEIRSASETLLSHINNILDILSRAQIHIEDKELKALIEGHDDERKAYSAGYLHFTAPNISVLLVDDNPMNLQVLKGLLAATKMHIETALSGEECLEKLKLGDYHIILLDHMMPGMDGIETLERIRADGKTIPVIALTANYISNGDEYYRSKGFDLYLPKPVESEALEAALRKVISPDKITELSEEHVKLKQAVLLDEYRWLYDVEGLDVEKGINFSGGIDGFLLSLRLFCETIDENAGVIEKAFLDEDYKLYTIKVHALKSSARIIGASALSSAAQHLEDAGKADDFSYIKDHNEAFINAYREFEKKLSSIRKKEDDSEKVLIKDEELSDALSAIKELVPQMDYDSVEMIITYVMRHRLENDDQKLFNELVKALHTFNWDKMEELLKDR